MERVVIALGGNAILKPTEEGSFSKQERDIADSAKEIAQFLKSSNAKVLITHGNGPQVGYELLKNETEEGKKLMRLPLFAVTAETQATIGALLEQALHTELTKRGIKREIAVVVTNTIVDPRSPSFKKPSKPVGGFFTAKELKDELKIEKFNFVKEKGMYRRVVASPEPKEIVETGTIKRLFENNTIVIGVGGGGIPVVRRGTKLTGINAVIDKDLASALIADRIDATRLIILTDVDYVYSDYKDKSGAIKEASAKEMKKRIGEFEEGTMKPKVEACVRFVETGKGREAFIGNLTKLKRIINGTSGTRIFG